jgi:exosortase A
MPAPFITRGYYHANAYLSEGHSDGLAQQTERRFLMNTPVLTEAPPITLSADWRKFLPPLTLGLLLLGGLFNIEVVTAVQTWDASTAYNHCFLIIPIALYLVWDRRHDLIGIPVQPMPQALVLGFPLAVLWLMSERLGIMEGRQLVAISFVELLFLAVLGKRLWWALAGPLLYLYFLVPFGEFLTPKLQDVTTFFIRHGLEILGVPAYIDGYVIEIPQGTFFVAEACAGLRFLIASIAFGCLYALMMYRSPVRRGLFILVSIIVPIIANGLRGIGIVYLGYLLGNAQAAAADHIIYGWIFFSAVILLLIALGLPFRQDEISTRSKWTHNRPTAPVSTRVVFAVTLGLFVVAAISPIVAAVLSMAAVPVTTPSRIEVGSDCKIQTRAAQTGAGIAARSQLVQCGDLPMVVSWESFSPRSTAAPVMSERRRMVSRVLTEGLSEHWLEPVDGTSSAWRILHSNDPTYIISTSVWIDGNPVRPGLVMRLRMAVNSVIGSAYAPMVVTVTPVANWETGSAAELRAAEASLPRFLLAHPDLDRTIGELSARP